MTSTSGYDLHPSLAETLNYRKTPLLPSDGAYIFPTLIIRTRDRPRLSIASCIIRLGYREKADPNTLQMTDGDKDIVGISKSHVRLPGGYRIAYLRG
jgi:hypothetical protein